MDKTGRSEPRETIREEERRRLARDLHDDLGQLLATLRLDLELHRRRLRESGADADPRVAGSLADLASALDGVAAGVRRVLAGLAPAPLGDRDLGAALRRLASDVASRGGLAVRVDVETGWCEATPEAAAALYRAAQELLTNVVRHAAASSLHLRLARADGHMVLEVCDDGVGPAAGGAGHAAGFGLRGLSDRASALGGRFSIRRHAPRGTCARFQVPCVTAHTGGRDGT